MPDALDPARLGLMAAVVAAAGLIRGFSGFGAGLVMVPALGLLITPPVAVPVVVLMEAVASAQLVPPALRQARWRAIIPLGIAATLTIPLGSRILATLDPDLLQRAISGVVLLFVVVLWAGWRYGKEPSLPVTGAVGAAGGLLTGAAGIGGPPVILFFLSGPNPAPRTRASLICYFAITQLVALAAFLAAGLLSRAVLVYTLILAPVFLIAAWIGTRFFGKVEERTFRKVALAFLALVALAGLVPWNL